MGFGFEQLTASSVLHVGRVFGGSLAGLLAAVSLGSCSAKPDVSAATEPALAHSPARVRVLTQDQYFNSLAYLFGADAHLDSRFPPFRRTDGLLALGAASAGITPGAVEKFQHTAQIIAAQVVDARHRDFLIPCKPASETAPDGACATKFLKATGRVLYHQPISAEKLAMAVGDANSGAERMHDFYRGLAFALEGMLVDPNFLFVVERSEPDPTRPGHQRLSAQSLATRLSLFLWNRLPDEALLQAADRGDLSTKAGRTKVIDKMMATPQFETGVRAFFDDMLGFDDLDSLSKDATIYPSFTGQTATDAREQTLRTIVEQLIKKNGDYRDLYTMRTTFLSPSLAAVYRVPVAPGWSRYEVPQNAGRAGLVSQVSFLAAHAHPARSSPTKRGKAVRELLLCQHVPDPPPNVDFSAVENPDPSLHTARDRLTLHRKNPVCAGCHRITDPIGLALENFDGAGQYRDNEKGSVIDASGSLDGHDFKDAAGLGQALHDDPALTECLVKRVFSYGLGSPDTGGRDDLMAYYQKKFADKGYKFVGLVRDIVLSDAFSEVTE